MFKNTNATTKLLLLMTTVIALVLLISITVTYRSNNKLISLQAKKMAQTVANQVVADRSHYVNRVVKKLKGSPFAPKEGYTDDSPHVPLPATFVMGVADDVSASQNEYKYKLVSRWNINPGNSLNDDFLNRGFANLVEQEKLAKANDQLSSSQPYKGWQPYYETLEIDGKPFLRFLAADLASGQACVTCHNGLEKREDVLTIRKDSSVEQGKVFELNDLMGAVAVDVNLEEAGAVAAASTRNMMTWLIVVGVGVLLVTISFVRRAMVKPINMMINKLEAIAQGDLTQRVEADRQDEFGRLGRRFNETIERLHDAIVEVGGVTTEVASASTQIAASSEEMAQGMVEQSKQVGQISSAIEQMSASVVEVSRKSIDAANNAAESGRVAEKGGTVVNQTIEGMNSISEAVRAGAASVTELGKRGEQIGQIIEVINDIADQTNLLALNAAIEAARAGEHGRGFAVVADEVRKLADRTTKATGEVAQSIKAIQAETSEAVRRMNAGTEQVTTGVERATEAGENLQLIVQSAQEVADMIRSIAAAAEQQSAASEEVSRNVVEVSAVSQEANQGANQSSEAASQLSSKAEQLQRLVGKFKTDAQGHGAADSASDHLKEAAKVFKAEL